MKVFSSETIDFVLRAIGSFYLVENAIRPTALGKKNYLFAGSHAGAQSAAMFYSFFATCKYNNVDP